MRSVRYLIAAMALSFAAPAFAGDLKDDAGAAKHETRKELRDMKPGDKTLSDRKDDAADTMKADAYKTRKKARHFGRHTKHRVHKAKVKATH